MSSRSSIVNGLVDVLKTINGTGTQQSNLYNNVTNKHKFWDEVNDFPHISVVAGPESRQYLPSDFKWGFLGISLKVYVKNEEPIAELEKLLEDIETVIDANRVLSYGTTAAERTTEILITSIVTDEGLLAPYGVGEVNLQVQYQVLN